MITACVVAAATAEASDVQCRVVGITDGDSLTCITDDRVAVKVRLAEIDAPERRQPFGQHAKQRLSDLCFEKHANLRVMTVDRYGRTVARVSCEMTKDVNAEMVVSGMAWVYDKYVTDRSLYRLQDAARSEGVGLWGARDPVQPWEWRRATR